MIPAEDARYIAVLDRSRRNGIDVRGIADVARLSWQDDAPCGRAAPELFFPEKGGSNKAAKRICAGCNVRAECLEYALANDERFGVWGGLSERERRDLPAGEREAAA